MYFETLPTEKCIKRGQEEKKDYTEREKIKKAERKKELWPRSVLSSSLLLLLLSASSQPWPSAMRVLTSSSKAASIVTIVEQGSRLLSLNTLKVRIPCIKEKKMIFCDRRQMGRVRLSWDYSSAFEDSKCLLNGLGTINLHPTRANSTCLTFHED